MSLSRKEYNQIRKIHSEHKKKGLVPNFDHLFKKPKKLRASKKTKKND